MINCKEQSFSFSLISPEAVNLLLSHVFTSYNNDPSRYKDNNSLMQQSLATLLHVSLDTLEQTEALRLKSLGQIMGLYGQAAKAPISSSYYENKAKELLEEAAEVPCFNEAKIIDFAGWNQPEYLLYQLYFFLELYVQIYADLVKPPVDKPLILNLLKEELWISANAYHLRSTYGNLIQLSNSAEKEEKLTTFINDFLANFITLATNVTNKKTVELAFPCGSKGHALYLTLIVYPQLQKLVLRLDNASEAKSEIITDFNPNNNAALTAVTTYLKEVCLVLKKPTHVAKKIIYNTEKTIHLPLSDYGNDFPAHREQTAENCVVEGFQIGLWYRLQKYQATHGNATFNWLHRQNVQFASLSHETPGYFEAGLEDNIGKATSATLKDENTQRFNTPSLNPTLFQPYPRQIQRGVFAQEPIQATQVAKEKTDQLQENITSHGGGVILNQTQ